APRGLTTTGDPSLNGPASFSGLPSLGLPSGLSANGLPFGIQLMAAPFAEDRLFATAKWCEAVLHFQQIPPLSRFSSVAEKFSAVGWNEWSEFQRWVEPGETQPTSWS